MTQLTHCKYPKSRILNEIEKKKKKSDYLLVSIALLLKPINIEYLKLQDKQTHRIRQSNSQNFEKKKKKQKTKLN